MSQTDQTGVDVIKSKAGKRVKAGKSTRAVGKSHIVFTFTYSLNESNSPSIMSLSKLQTTIDTFRGWIARRDEDKRTWNGKTVFITTLYVAFPVGQGTKFQGKTYTDIVNIIGSHTRLFFNAYYTTNGRIAWQGTGGSGRKNDVKETTKQAKRNQVSRRQQYRENAATLDEMLANIMQEKRRAARKVFGLLKANAKKRGKLLSREFFAVFNWNPHDKNALERSKCARLMSRLNGIYRKIQKLSFYWDNGTIHESMQDIAEKILAKLDKEATSLELFLSDKGFRAERQASMDEKAVPIGSQAIDSTIYPDNEQKPLTIDVMDLLRARTGYEKTEKQEKQSENIVAMGYNRICPFPYTLSYGEYI